jgi:hypothetical protein
MAGFQFSTVCENNAKNFLNHESFNYLSEGQKELILNNLGKVRVLDPMFHAGGLISFSDPNDDLMIEFIKLSVITDTESFMFKYSYIYPNFKIIKWGLEQGFPFHYTAIETMSKRNNLDALCFFIDSAYCSKETVLNKVIEFSSFEFICSFIKAKGIKKLSFPYFYKDEDKLKFTPSQLLYFAENKYCSISQIKESFPEQYKKIMQFKKLKSEWVKSVNNVKEYPSLFNDTIIKANNVFKNKGFELQQLTV